MKSLYSVGDFCIYTRVILDFKSDSWTTVYQQLMKITDVYIKKNTFEYTCSYGSEKVRYQGNIRENLLRELTCREKRFLKKERFLDLPQDFCKESR